MGNLPNFNTNKLQARRLDRGFGFGILKIVNLTAFLRFGGRRQFFYFRAERGNKVLAKRGSYP